MHFCKNCNFMYYIKTDDDNLIYYCRNCNYEDKALANNSENLCVSKIKLNQTKSSFINKINEYTKLDPTLPPCPALPFLETLKLTPLSTPFGMLTVSFTELWLVPRPLQDMHGLLITCPRPSQFPQTYWIMKGP